MPVPCIAAMNRHPSIVPRYTLMTSAKNGQGTAHFVQDNTIDIGSLEKKENGTMKIAIIGGAGFIGSRLTRAYLNAGHDVFVIDSLCTGAHRIIDPRARFYHVDMRNEQLYALLQRERPDIVSYHAVQNLHEISGERVRADADVNVRGLLHVLECSVAATVRKFIFASSGNALYKPIGAGHMPLTEDATVYPQLPLAITKIVGEWYVRYYSQQYGLKHTILRYADVYGETDITRINSASHPLSYFVSMLKEERRPIIRGSRDLMHDHIFVDDVVQANLCVLKKGENQTYHISTGRGYTISQLYQIVAQVMGSNVEPVYISGSLAEACSVVLDNTRAKRELDWYPRVGLQEGVRYIVQQLCALRPAIKLSRIEHVTI